MNKRYSEFVFTLISATLLLFASTGRRPYGFYMVLRLVITVGAVYWAWRVYQVKLRAWTWAFVAIAFLSTPSFQSECSGPNGSQSI